jgi:hypothetical protein
MVSLNRPQVYIFSITTTTVGIIKFLVVGPFPVYNRG